MRNEREDLDGVSLEFLLFNIQDIRNYIFNNLNSFIEIFKIDKENNDNEENYIEGKCSICLDFKKLRNKFKCKHSTCIECFHEQLKSKVDLVCCLCRSEIDIKKLRRDEKIMFDNRNYK